MISRVQGNTGQDKERKQREANGRGWKSFCDVLQTPVGKVNQCKVPTGRWAAKDGGQLFPLNAV